MRETDSPQDTHSAQDLVVDADGEFASNLIRTIFVYVGIAIAVNRQG